ncbi:MAG: hypothetical protein IKA95_03495 [Clostridia bacterium]|nr:hypothetical protein [Clostridia bacterium]
MKTDWRLTNQKEYLFGKTLLKGSFKVYREGWEHEHCAFCSERIDSSTTMAYSTEDHYHWICEDCFNDFKKMFEWVVVPLEKI